MQVVPAIIPRSRQQLEDEIKLVSGFADLVQVDIADGVFAPVKTWPYNGKDEDYFELLKKEDTGWPEWEKTDIELHLMVQNPVEVVQDWISTGVSAIVAHIEAAPKFQQIIDICRERNVSVGMAIKPSTDISLAKLFAEDVDFIQVMGSDSIGKHGVALDPAAIRMISALRALYPERIISIDIGVNEDTAQMLVDAGANKLIVGSAILEAANPRKVFQYLHSLN